MGAFAQVSAGPVGGGAPNAGYILRPQAAEEEEEGGIFFHNAPEDVEQAKTRKETRVRLQSWAEQVEAEEKARHGNRAGQPRTHYRGILSYEDTIETDAAREDALEFLEEEFPQARAVGVVHQDTDHTHVHIWMSARRVDEKKVHISRQDVKDIHKTFDRIYEERMNVRSRTAEKVEETWEFERKLTEMKEEGASIEELRAYSQEHRPERATPPRPEVYRKRDRRQTGEGVLEKIRKERQEREWRIEAVRKRRNEADKAHQSHERNEGGSEEEERRASEGTEGDERGERAIEGRGHRVGGRGHQGSDQRGTGRSKKRNRHRSEESQQDGGRGRSGEEKHRNGEGRSGGRDGQPEGHDSGRDEPGSGESVDDHSGGAGSRSSRERSRESSDRPDQMGIGGRADLERSSSSSDSGDRGRDQGDKGLGKQSESWSERQRRIHAKVKGLVRAYDREGHDEEAQRVVLAQERLLTQLDEKPIREDTLPGEVPGEIRDLADDLEGRERATLKKYWNYTAAARNAGLDPVEAFQEGWVPAESQGDRSQEKQSQDQQSRDKSHQDRDQSQDRDRGGQRRGWGHGR